MTFVEELKTIVGFDGFVELLQKQKDDANPDLLRLIDMMTTPEFLIMIGQLQANEYFQVSIVYFDNMLFLLNFAHLQSCRNSWILEGNGTWIFTKPLPRSLFSSGGTCPRNELHQSLTAVRELSGSFSTRGLNTLSSSISLCSGHGLLMCSKSIPKHRILSLTCKAKTSWS